MLFGLTSAEAGLMLSLYRDFSEVLPFKGRPLLARHHRALTTHEEVNFMHSCIETNDNFPHGHVPAPHHAPQSCILTCRTPQNETMENLMRRAYQIKGPRRNPFGKPGGANFGVSTSLSMRTRRFAARWTYYINAPIM